MCGSVQKRNIRRKDGKCEEDRQQGTGADLIFAFESPEEFENENEDERASSLFKNTR